MSLGEIEAIIISVNSPEEFRSYILESLELEDHPILQSLLLLNVLRTLESFASKIGNNKENQAEALLRLLASYAQSLDLIWEYQCLDLGIRTKSFYGLYLSERALFTQRYL